MNTRLKHIQNWLKLAQDAEWSVKRMAQICEVSVRGLELHFESALGSPPKKWLTEQRMRQAMKDLQEGFSVKETAARLAYKHTHHFSRQFKKHWGFCPIKSSSKTPRFRVLV